MIIQDPPNIQSDEIAKRLSIPAPTVKRTLADLAAKGLIEKQGIECRVGYTTR